MAYERLTVSWNAGEDSLDLNGSRDEEGNLSFSADLESSPDGAAGLTLEEDFAYGITCKAMPLVK